MNTSPKTTSSPDLKTSLCLLLELPATANDSDIVASVSVLKREIADLRERAAADLTKKRADDEFEQAVQNRITKARGGLTYEQARGCEQNQRAHDAGTLGKPSVSAKTTK